MDVDSDGTSVTLNTRFPGQQYDPETGLHYNYFRYYDPSTGRYITSDPIGLAGGLNTYGYVGGNPMGYSDPTGESALHILRGAGWVGHQAGRRYIAPGINVGIRWASGRRYLSLGDWAYEMLNENANDDADADTNDEKIETQKCRRLRQKIDNLKEEIYGKRFPDLDNNPGNLPWYIGPGERQRDTIRGHSQLLNDRWTRLREYERQYDEECPPECGE